jgi:hypothetical protein
MPKVLNTTQVEAYHRDGYAFPFKVLDGAEITAIRGSYDSLVAREGGKLSKRTNIKPHLLQPFLAELVRHPRILDAIEDVLGPNIFCWSSGFFSKGPGDGGFVSWHQDSTYWGLSSPDVCTAWVAFSPSKLVSGAMKVMPGTHLMEQVPHRDTFAKDNLLSRGQEVEVEVDEKQAVALELDPGEMSLHHVRLIHGSEPNRSDYHRIGYTIRYVATHVRQIAGPKDSASLVRGSDSYGYFEPEPRPTREGDPACVAYHDALIKRTDDILYRGAAQRRVIEPMKAS